MYFGNIMWAIDAEGDIQNDIVAFIDWQTMREGSPMEDLARFLILCADGIVRRQAEEFAIQYYFDCLITEFGNIKKVPYSMAQLEKAYKYAFIIESMKKNGLGVVPFFLGTVNDKKIDKSVKDAFRDYGILKVLHLYEDVDKLLMNEMKDIYDQFGN
uniref:Uncharacterized protein n=1 Tax=Panagrolaimus superbus TaxID=310955 RepID=A0A914YDC4_9BILA